MEDLKKTKKTGNSYRTESCSGSGPGTEVEKLYRKTERTGPMGSQTERRDGWRMNKAEGTALVGEKAGPQEPSKAE